MTTNDELRSRVTGIVAEAVLLVEGARAMARGKLTGGEGRASVEVAICRWLVASHGWRPAVAARLAAKVLDQVQGKGSRSDA